MERNPHLITVDMLPERQRALVTKVQEVKNHLNRLKEADNHSIGVKVDEFLMREANGLRNYARENFGTVSHLQKVPSWQAMIGGSLELTHPETPAELVAYVEERVQGMVAHITAMIEGADDSR